MSSQTLDAGADNPSYASCLATCLNLGCEHHPGLYLSSSRNERPTLRPLSSYQLIGENNPSFGGLSDLPEFNNHAFRVLALRAFEGSEIESRLTRLNLRKIHLRGAFWAPRAIIYVRVFRRIFEWWHVQAAYSIPTA
jgi:hypothetical protein